MFEAVWSKPHKYKMSGAVHGDCLLLNTDLRNYAFLPFCKFIFLIQSPKSVINNLIAINKMKPIVALNAYSFRLRRMYELARRKREGVFLLYSDLQEGKGYEYIERYLGLRTPLEKVQFPEHQYKEKADYELTQSATLIFERYYYLFSQLRLNRL